MKKLFFALGLVLTLFSCQEASNSSSFKVVCTTGMLGNAAEALLSGIDSVQVKVLMGPGVDPHLYKATQGDIRSLSEAHLIVYNGLHLEGKMTEVFSRIRQSRVHAAAEVIPAHDLINATDYAEAHDPHVWLDPLAWQKVVDGLAKVLQEELPQQTEAIENNRLKYGKALYSTHLKTDSIIGLIPDQQRVLVTAHDAFKYFGRRYGLEVKGLQGISTSSEYGIRDISELVNFLERRKIKAIFVESSVSPRAIEAVIESASERGHIVNLGGELYSDALGAQGSAAETHLKMIVHNAQTIATALR